MEVKRMTKNIKKAIIFIVVAVSLCVLLAMMVSAETYQLQYKDVKFNNKTKVATDENGQITLLDTKFTADDGKRVFYGWVDDTNGNVYAPGATITLTENMVLREAFAFEVASAEEFNNVIKASAMKDNNIYKLTADIESNARFGLIEWSTQAIDLNGHTLTITITGNDDAFSMKRGKVMIFNSSENEGKIVATLKDSTYGVVGLEGHGYGDGDHGVALVVGKGVSIETNGSLVRQKNSMLNSNQTNCPKVDIFGKVSADYIIYQGGSQANAATITIHDGADVTVSGTTWFKSTNTLQTCQGVLAIEGGKVKFENEDFEWYDNAVKYQFNLKGGHLNIQPADGILKEGYKAVPVDVDDYEIKFVGCTVPGSNGVHEYVQSEAFNNEVATCTQSGTYYFRCQCGDFYTKAVPALGHDYSIVTIDRTAEYGAPGLKTRSCSRCNSSTTYEYQCDPSDVMTKVVVSTGEGTKEISVKASDLFTFTVVEANGSYTAKVTAIKNFADPDDAGVTYKIADIKELYVPAGFTGIVVKNATILEKVVFANGVSMFIDKAAFDNCPELKSIEFGTGKLTFDQYVLNKCTKFETLDVSKASVEFKNYAFKDSTIKELKLGSGNAYSFYQECFRNTQLTKVELPDNDSDIIKFAGGKPFYGIKTLKYVYVGKGITKINNNPFDCCYNLELVVLMDVTSMTEYCFCCGSGDYAETKADSKDGLYVYHHADSLSIHNNTFANRHTYGVKLFTKANVTSMNNINTYWIYKGIPHAYTEGNVEATCTAMGSTGYTTNCPCGEVENANYTLYKKASGTTSTEEGSIAATTTPALGHDFTVFLSKVDANCQTAEYTTYKCSRCEETSTVKTGEKTAHTLEAEWTVVAEATCTSDGLKIKNCTVCNTVGASEVLHAEGHKPAAEWTIKKAATCTVGEYKVKYCTVCDEIAEESIGEPLQHIKGDEWIVVYEAKCLVAGEEKQVCTRCNAAMETRVINPLGHEYDISKGAVASALAFPNGFGSAGTSTVKCARCDVVSNSSTEPIFKSIGISVNGAKDAVYFGFSVDVALLEAYEQFNGELDFGFIVANADTFGPESTLLTNEKALNSEKGYMVDLSTKQYAIVGVSIRNIVSESAKALNVLVVIYTDDGNKVRFVRVEGEHTSARGIGDDILNVVTLNDVLQI